MTCGYEAVARQRIGIREDWLGRGKHSLGEAAASIRIRSIYLEQACSDTHSSRRARSARHERRLAHCADKQPNII